MSNDCFHLEGSNDYCNHIGFFKHGGIIKDSSVADKNSNYCRFSYHHCDLLNKNIVYDNILFYYSELDNTKFKVDPIIDMPGKCPRLHINKQLTLF